MGFFSNVVRSFTGSGGGSLLGSALGGPLGSFIGGSIGSSNDQRRADRRMWELRHHDARLQENFAKSGIQWRVEDAKKAGIHPLAALGAQTHMASPSLIQGNPTAGQDMAAMGQDIGRALATKMSSHEKQLMDINLKNAQMDSEMKAIELTNARRSLQTGNDGVRVKPAEVTAHVKNRKNIEAGTISSTGYARTASGGLAPVPSKDVKERIEDQFIPEMAWAAQNYIGPLVGQKGTKPPKKYLPKGAKDWQWSIRKGEWQPVKTKGKTPWQRWSRWVTKWQD
jgi:hypothetical protein